MNKLLLIPRVIWDGARSFRSWLKLPKNPSDPAEAQDAARLKNNLGWTGPEMEEHWASYIDHKDFHHRKNLGSEWVRSDAQRAYKFGSFIIVALVLALFVACIGILITAVI